MKKLQEIWENLQLNEDEWVAIDIEGDGIIEVLKRGDRSLIGKIWSERQIGKAVVESTITEMGQNIFIITFATHADKHRVENERPWLFDGNLFVMKEFDGFTTLENVSFDMAAMWVQFHNLPLVWMSGTKLESLLGVAEDVEVDDDDDVGWDISLRVKILLDLRKPLARGRIVMLRGLKTWVPIQYEKLPRFCLQCGCVIHEKSRCPNFTSVMVDNKQFGS
ncbi:uncharacterized protein LOC122304562 [Carya illinoinensis]|uniref:uncharacterized protein LOC122304562 n=1 Tax=Carya illinoinensis TaxID=32201 RepID=UPI001C724F4A|nr:uncharacterized protein LOC122304562 [Carya illinoinensis]